jgi:lycopene beta-cyclase
LFSEKLLTENNYDEAIKAYLNALDTGAYKIERFEKGNIPMTCFLFDKLNSKNTIRIGSAGGWTKASTGFTFKNTDRISARLVNFLKEENDFRKFKTRNRFWFYDLILLDVLSADNQQGAFIFSSVFSKNKPQSVFRFLDEQSTFFEELKIILSCPKKPFINAFLRRIRDGF